MRLCTTSTAGLQLPTGALTVIVLGGHDLAGDGPAVVTELARASRQAGLRMVYVLSGDDHIPPLRNDFDAGICVLSDLEEDGSWASGRIVPTLTTVRHALRECESVEGTAVVIFNDVMKAGPYWLASCGDTEEYLPIPDGFRLSEAEADRWRAKSMAEFAASRPAVPTVVVSEFRETDLSGLAALQAVAGLTVTSTSAAGGHQLRVGTRQSVRPRGEPGSGREATALR